MQAARLLGHVDVQKTNFHHRSYVIEWVESCLKSNTAIKSA